MRAAVPAFPALPPGALAAVLLLAGASDALDGQVARRRHAQTRLGAWLDPTVDALVVSVAAVVLAHTGLLPPWAAGLVVARFALPAVAIAFVYFVTASQPRRACTCRADFPGWLCSRGSCSHCTAPSLSPRSERSAALRHSPQPRCGRSR